MKQRTPTRVVPSLPSTGKERLFCFMNLGEGTEFASPITGSDFNNDKCIWRNSASSASSLHENTHSSLPVVACHCLSRWSSELSLTDTVRSCSSVSSPAWLTDIKAHPLTFISNKNYCFDLHLPLAVDAKVHGVSSCFLLVSFPKLQNLLLQPLHGFHVFLLPLNILIGTIL